MRNYLKAGTFLFGVLIILTQCTDHPSKTLENPVKEIPNFQHQFNTEIFSDVIPYQFRVNWEKGTKGYSKELESTYYEFPVIWETNFNPDALADRHPNRLTYKIIAAPDGAKPTFYVLKFVEPGDTKTPNLSWSEPGDFTGRIYLLDQQDERIDAKQYKDGKLQGEITAIS